jgi:hypothetical protein
MIIAARMAVQRWAANPKLQGDPNFVLAADSPVQPPVPFRHFFLEKVDGQYLYAVHAQDVLDLLGISEEPLEVRTARSQLAAQWRQNR